MLGAMGEQANEFRLRYSPVSSGWVMVFNLRMI